MKLRGLNTYQKLILNFLYKMRNTPMAPPDPRISFMGIAQSLGIQAQALFPQLDVLTERGFIMPFWIETKRFYTITLAGIHEVERHVITTIEGELSTSNIGIKGTRKQTN